MYAEFTKKKVFLLDLGRIAVMADKKCRSPITLWDQHFLSAMKAMLCQAFLVL